MDRPREGRKEGSRNVEKLTQYYSPRSFALHRTTLTPSGEPSLSTPFGGSIIYLRTTEKLKKKKKKELSRQRP